MLSLFTFLRSKQFQQILFKYIVHIYHYIIIIINTNMATNYLEQYQPTVIYKHQSTIDPKSVLKQDKEIRKIESHKVQNKTQIQTIFNPSSDFYDRSHIKCKLCLNSKFKCKNCLDTIIQKINHVKKIYANALLNNQFDIFNKEIQEISSNPQKLIKVQKIQNKGVMAKIKLMNKPNQIQALHENKLELEYNCVQEMINKKNKKSVSNFDDFLQNVMKKKNTRLSLQQRCLRPDRKLKIQNLEIADSNFEQKSSSLDIFKKNNQFKLKNLNYNNKRRLNISTHQTINILQLPSIKQANIQPKMSKHESKPKIQRRILIPRYSQRYQNLKKQEQELFEEINGWQNGNLYQQDHFNCLLEFQYIYEINIEGQEFDLI